MRYLGRVITFVPSMGTSRCVWKRVLFVALATALLPAARAFDVDTHYVWTFYLAQHVGYTPADVCGAVGGG